MCITLVLSAVKKQVSMRIGICYCSLKEALKSIGSSQSGSIYQIYMDLELSRLTIMMPHLLGVWNSVGQGIKGGLGCSLL